MVKFIVDSTFGLTRDYAAENDIGMVSLTVSINGKEFEEGYQEEWGEFYSEYIGSKQPAKSSQPAPEKFTAQIEKAYAEHPDCDIIILTIADRLSGTVNSARLAVKPYAESGKNIVALNSGVAGVSALVMLRELIKARNAGADYKTLVDMVGDLCSRIAMQFVPASLTELARSGRVNKLLSRVGNILKIKPVFEFANNDLSVYAKVLGLNKAFDAAIAHLPKEYESILLYYIGDDKNIDPLKKRIAARLGLTDLAVEAMCPVGGVHIGVGTVGIVTLKTK